MNRKPPLPHPNLALFVQVVEEEGHVQVQRMNDVRCGRVIPPAYPDTTISNISGCYAGWIIKRHKIPTNFGSPTRVL